MSRGVVEMHLEAAEFRWRAADFPLDDEAEPAPAHGVSLAAHLMMLEIGAAVVSARRARAKSSKRRRAHPGAQPQLGAFTDIRARRALARAASIDASRASGKTLRPLAGAPFAAKNLFDVAGLTTRAGPDQSRPSPRRRDATLAARLEAAGATRVGALNMAKMPTTSPGECARRALAQPHEPGRMTGGSSGGSAAAVAAAWAVRARLRDQRLDPRAEIAVRPVRPQTDRRRPSRAGTVPFVASFDHLGLLARSVGDLSASHDAMQGRDARDPRRPRARSSRPSRPRRRARLSRPRGSRSFRARRRAGRVRGGGSRRRRAGGDAHDRVAGNRGCPRERLSLRWTKARRRTPTIARAADEFDAEVRDRFACAMLPAPGRESAEIARLVS